MLYMLFGKKKCKNCGRLSQREVLFCWACGCSFNYRICVAGHKNSPKVHFCRTCGKDRSLMSRPHDSNELSFAKHPTKPLTYIPERQKIPQILAWVAVVIGATILSCAIFLMINNL